MGFMDPEERKKVTRDLAVALETEQAAGDVPDWYVVLRYAQFLCIAPWDLEAVVEDHPEWIERARIAMEAEGEAKRRARMRRRQLLIRETDRPSMEGVPIPRVDAVARKRGC